VYFGGEYKGRQSATSYNPGGLEPCGDYNWCIDQVEYYLDETILVKTGDDWSFTTEPMPVVTETTSPYPADGAEDVPLDVVLSWDPGCGAIQHDVYFGTSSPPAFIGNQTLSSYDPGTLEPGTNYYWKVDEVEADGTTKHTGVIWSFTTEQPTSSVRYVRWHKITNRQKNDLVEVSKEYDLPAGEKPVGFSVARWVEGIRWVDETDKWNCTMSQPKAGTWVLRFRPKKGASPVPKGTRLGFHVKFSCDRSEIGFRPGSDRKYKPDPCPKNALKKTGIVAPSGRFKVEIDNAVFYGGEMGKSIPELGLDIPPYTYAYLYQVNAIEGPSSITFFRLSDMSEMFEDFSELDVSHDGSTEWEYISDEIGEPNAGDPEISVATFDRLGASGVAPTYWGPDGDDFVAYFAGLSAGQSSNILVAFSSIGPDMPDKQLNAWISDGAVFVDGLVWTPTHISRPILIGDLNFDDVVDFADLAVLGDMWLQKSYRPLTADKEQEPCDKCIKRSYSYPKVWITIKDIDLEECNEFMRKEEELEGGWVWCWDKCSKEQLCDVDRRCWKDKSANAIGQCYQDVESVKVLKRKYDTKKRVCYIRVKCICTCSCE